jgi:hypothetical protein
MNRTTLRMLCVAGFALVGASCSQGGQTNANTGGSESSGGVHQREWWILLGRHDQYRRYDRLLRG